MASNTLSPKSSSADSSKTAPQFISRLCSVGQFEQLREAVVCDDQERFEQLLQVIAKQAIRDRLAAREMSKTPRPWIPVH